MIFEVLPHLTFPMVPLFSVQLSFPLDTFCHGVDGVNCWDSRTLGKGWRMKPGWNQGQEHQLGSSSQQVKWEEGNELATAWLLFPGRRGCSETLKWGSAVPWALQLVLPCCSPPCCLHCHRHLQPASSTLHSQHISQTTSFLPLLPTKRGQRAKNLPCSMHACSLGAFGQRDGWMWEKEEVFKWNGEKKMHCGDLGLA